MMVHTAYSPQAIEARYRTSSKRLCLFAASILGNHAEAEDVVQDVFTDFAIGKRRFEDSERWCLAVVKNASLMLLRQRKHTCIELRADHVQQADTAHAGQGSAPEPETDPENLRQKLYSHASTPEETAILDTMLRIGGAQVPVKGTAKALSLPEKQVRATITRLLRRAGVKR